MKYCPYCGSQLDGDFAFCPKCGKGLNKRKVETSSPSESIDSDNYYRVLGISSSASENEIKTAFKEIAKKCHPDVNGGKAELTDRFRKAAEAYEVLKNPERRAAYDQYCAMDSSTPGASTHFHEDYMYDARQEAMRTEAYIHSMFEDLKDRWKEAMVSFLIGLAFIAGGIILTLASMAIANHFGGRGIITVGLLLCGVIGAIKNFFHAIVLSVELARFKIKFWDSI